MCTGLITYVSVRPGSHEPVPIPAELRAKLESCAAVEARRLQAVFEGGDYQGRAGSGSEGVTVFERFTDRARRVVVLAQEEARLLNHNYIGTEHILLGLIHEGEGVAATALESLGRLTRTGAGADEEIVGHGVEAPSGHIPFTPRSKKVLELSLREAMQLGHNYIGTEHILLGMIREGQGVAAQVLVEEGLELGRVRQQIIQLLSGYPGPSAGQPVVRAVRSTAGAPPGPVSGFGVRTASDVGARCSFCLRTIEHVERYVRGRTH